MKNGVTKDTESYNKRIGVKDRDTRQATEGTREASTTVETRARDRRRGKERERERNGPAFPCKAHPGIQPLRRAGEMLKKREQYLSRTEETKRDRETARLRETGSDF